MDTTSCSGLCHQGPAILVNGWAIPRMTPGRVDEVAELIRNDTPVETWPGELFAIDDNIQRADILLGTTLEPGDARISVSSGVLRAQATLAFVPELRPFMAVGLVQGSISLRNLKSGSILPTRTAATVSRRNCAAGWSAGTMGGRARRRARRFT